MYVNFIIKIILTLVIIVPFEQLNCQEYKDCEKPYRICDLKTYHIESTKGIGDKTDSFKGLKCTDHLIETNSYWIDFEVIEDGNLTFVIDPARKSDDIDFILFKKHANSCDRLQEVRCMSSGLTYNDYKDTYNKNCQGQTGLSIRSLDDFEKAGCKYNDDNYLKFLDARAGEHYILMINNYNSGKGFSISFDGDCQIKSSKDCQVKEYISPITLLDLYPNPANSVINIDYTSSVISDVEFTVYNIVGKAVINERSEGTSGENRKSILVDDLPGGTYILSISNDGYTINKSFIKQ